MCQTALSEEVLTLHINTPPTDQHNAHIFTAVFSVSQSFVFASRFLDTQCNTDRVLFGSRKRIASQFGSRSTSQFAPRGNLLVCIVTKRDFTESILVVIIFLTSLSETIQDIMNFIQFWVLVSCLQYSCHVRSTQKERINNQKVVAEHFVFLRRKGEDLVVHRVPREWVLLEYSNDANDE